MSSDSSSRPSLLRAPETRLIVFGWLALMAAALMLRPLLPIDETRYLSVAWAMWNDGSYLVPHLNGETYSHKPPLMFWAMNLGWAVFGTSEIWARLVAPLFGLAALGLTALIARQLWPSEQRIAATAPVLLFSAVYWAVFSTLTMFDTVLAFAALVALLGVIGAWRNMVDGGPVWRWVLLAGLGLGIGGLAKGPAILLHVLPVALLAPWWGPKLTGAKPTSWKKWYGAVGLAILIGFMVALAWAIPAAIAGGPEYRDAIFWGQSAGRMVESFAHRRPPWWFAQYLPLLLLPWFVWPRLWRGVGLRAAWREKRGLRAALDDGGVRLLVVWFGFSFVAFSAISGKQLHYLLPEFPALALFGAFVLSRHSNAQHDTEHEGGETAHRIPALVLGLLSAIIMAVGLVLPLLEGIIKKIPPGSLDGEPLWMAVPVALALSVAFFRIPGWARKVRVLALITVVNVVFLHAASAGTLGYSYNLGPAAKKVAHWQAQGRKVAYVGKYHGEFHFLGRLTEPLVVLPSRGQAAAWARQNPTGVLLSTVRHAAEMPPPAPAPSEIWPYRGRLMGVWEAKNFPR